MSTIDINESVGSRSYNDLLYPGFEVATEHFTVASGEILVKNELVARNSSGEIVAYNVSGGSGANTAYAIAVHDVDASGGAVRAEFYVKAVVNENKLILSDSNSTISTTV